MKVVRVGAITATVTKPWATDSRSRVLAAAQELIQRVPLTEINISMIARASGLSRKTIYKYFDDLTDLFESLFIEYGRLVHEPQYESILSSGLTESSLEQLVWTEIENTYTFFSYTQISDQRVLSEIADFFLYSKRIREYRFETWLPVLGRFQEAGALKEGLDLQEVSRWLTYQQCLLVCHPRALSDDQRSLRRFIRRFLIQPLLATPEPAAPSSTKRSRNGTARANPPSGSAPLSPGG